MNLKLIREYVREIIKSVLEEGLICTYPIDSAIRHMVKNYGMTTNKLVFQENYGYIYGYVEKTFLDNGENGIMIIMPNRNSEIKNVLKDMEVYGYFKSIEKTIFGNAYVQIMFEKKHQNDVTEKVRKLKKIWHSSPIRYKHKILKNGLIPKSENKKGIHPERIYFALNLKDIRDIEDELSEFYDSEPMVVYEINPRKLPKHIKFYYDPNAENCIYTTDNISPEYIENNKTLK